jgi:magnesium chelatase family protein
MEVLERATAALGLSARAHHRILRVARTIADLGGRAEITTAHMSEAISLRRFDRSRATGSAPVPATVAKETE